LHATIDRRRLATAIVPDDDGGIGAAANHHALRVPRFETSQRHNPQKHWRFQGFQDVTQHVTTRGKPAQTSQISEKSGGHDREQLIVGRTAPALRQHYSYDGISLGA
jgi:hypothetical protein